MKKRMILALVLVFALLCLACSHDADDGTSESSLTSEQSATSESSASSSVSSADGTSSADETSGESDTSSETSTGAESSSTSSDTSTSSKPAENSESSKPAENSKPTEGSENSGSVDTSSGSGNPSQTAHTHNYKTTVVKPTCTENGYTLHKCSCGDSYTDSEVPATGHELDTWTFRTAQQSTYTEKGIHERQCTNCGEWVTDEEYDRLWAPPVNDELTVYQRIISLKEQYPNGSEWGHDTYYDATGKGPGGYGSSTACDGFAHMVSNTAFGMYWGHRTLTTGFSMEDIRIGDLIYEKGKAHVAVVLETFIDHITVVEGNVTSGGNGYVRWGRNISREEVERATIETRYDPVYF